jgi:hypothetical protein
MLSTPIKVPMPPAVRMSAQPLRNRPATEAEVRPKLSAVSHFERDPGGRSSACRAAVAVGTSISRASRALGDGVGLAQLAQIDLTRLQMSERDVMEYDVVTVGAGPAGLCVRDPAEAAEARLSRLRDREGLDHRRADPVRRGDRTGPLDELLPEWRESPPPICVPPRG